MTSLNILGYEWKHFVRSPFKVVALLLFVAASVYGLHNGARLYETQMDEVANIEAKMSEARQECLAFYEADQKGPEKRPWVDVTAPMWAMWYANIYHFKTPSSAMVFSIGQAEQYGFYKKITTRASSYDNDLTQEIANPERLQTGSLDFAFALLYLLPLVLLIMLYNLNSMEAEQGFLPLIEVQTASRYWWLGSRMLFYIGLLWIVLLGLLIYGAYLTGVFTNAGFAFGQMLFWSSLYLLFWSGLFFLLIRNSTTILSNALKMVGAWLLFAFIIPATVHQGVSIVQPAGFMTELIDAQRDQIWKLYDLPDSVLHARIEQRFPEIANSPIAEDRKKRQMAYKASTPALFNDLVKTSIVPIEQAYRDRNQLIRWSTLFNPVTFFQNQFNQVTETHFDDYLNYRHELQSLIDQQINTLVTDTWEGKVVTPSHFENYIQDLSQP
ncbi:MAG: hypothetical protein ACFB10_04390 [Salibacteraceae bacterium]